MSESAPAGPHCAGPPFGFPVLYTPVLRLLWPYARHAADAFEVSAEVLVSLCWIESGFEPDALGPTGRQGLLSMTPALAATLANELGIPKPNLQEPYLALRLGACYLARLQAEFDSITLTLLAWHVGPELVRTQGTALVSNPRYAAWLQRVLLTLVWVAETRPWQPGRTRETESDTHAYRMLSRRLTTHGPEDVA